MVGQVGVGGSPPWSYTQKSPHGALLIPPFSCKMAVDEEKRPAGRRKLAQGEGQAFVPTVSRDDAEGLLLMEEEGHSDLISFQPTDSDLPSFLEDCNRV